MLGIYSGEHDNKSACLLLARQVKSGIPYCVLFSIMILVGADFISGAYGLTESLRFAFLCMSFGMIPALCNCILSGYYNVSGYPMWANAIILLRVFAQACLRFVSKTAIHGGFYLQEKSSRCLSGLWRQARAIISTGVAPVSC
jgi:uncharacterized membrane protein YoaK (UPF0700 family)